MTAKSKPALAKFRRDHVRVDWYPTGRAVQATRVQQLNAKER